MKNDHLANTQPGKSTKRSLEYISECNFSSSRAFNLIQEGTSYVKRPLDDPAWRIVTLDMEPLAESTQTPRGPFWPIE